jgi:hypothetical protein
MTTLRACAIAAACIFASQTYAADWAPLDERLKEFRPYVIGAAGVASGVDSKDTVSFFKLGAGVKMGRYVALELNRLDAAKFSQDKGAPSSCSEVSEPATCTGDYFNKTELKLDGFALGVVGHVPLSQATNLILRSDIASLDQEITRSGQNSTTPFTSPGTRTAIQDKRAEKVTYYGVGIGVERRVARTVFVRGMAEYYSASFFGGEEGEKFFSANIQMLKRL